MSTTSISVTKNLTGSINYVLYGTGEKKKQNENNGTTRAVAVSCSVKGGVKAFWKLGNDIKRRNSKIKNVGYNIIQSFNDKQFNYKNKKDSRIVNGLGVELAHRLFPNSPVLVVTHNDGKGHKLHNHIIVLNYDLQTQKAIRKNRSIKIVRTVNDKLMKENSLDTVAYGRNFNKEVNNQFDLLLLSKLENAQRQAIDFDDYTKRLDILGVSVVKKEKNGITGLTYKMIDKSHKNKNDEVKPRLRRRKASRFGEQFTFTGLQTQFILNRKKQEEERQKHLKEIKKIMSARLKQHEPVEITKNVDSHSKKREKSDRKEVQNQTVIKRIHIDDAQTALTDNSKSNDRQAIQELSDLGETSSIKKTARERSPRPQRDKKSPKPKTTAKIQHNRKKHEKIILPRGYDALLEINNEQQKKHDDSKQF